MKITTYEELERELAWTKAKLKAVFEIIPAHIHILDTQFNILDANFKPELLEKLGINKFQDIIGKKCYEIFKERTSICPECSVEQCFLSGKLETRQSTAEEDELLGLSTKLYAAPIRNSEGKIIGVIELAMDITDLKKAEEKLIELNRKLNELAHKDELTGLFNRRSFHERLSYEFSFAQRHSRPLSLLMLDFDHFKQINDTFGHSTGDNILSDFGKLLNRFIRIEDHASRYGGEEFMIILPNTDETQALQTSQRLRVQVAETNWQPCNVTISVGIVTIPPFIYSENQLITKADQALYQAKKQGRNQVVIASQVNNSGSSTVS